MGSKHLCSLADKGMPKDDPKRYKKLVKGGKHYCSKCGRIAAKDKSLCKPECL